MSESSQHDGVKIEAPKTPNRELSLQDTEYVVDKLYKGQSIDLGSFYPLLSQAEVIARTGFNLGELVAKVQLPYLVGGHLYMEADLDANRKPNSLYCFRKADSEEKDGRHAESAFLIMGEGQFEAIMRQEDVSPKDMLRLSAKGERKKIGRDHWMPDNGNTPPKTQEAKDKAYKRSPAVSRDHGSFEIGKDGHLLFHISERAHDVHATSISRAPRNKREMDEYLAEKYGH